MKAKFVRTCLGYPQGWKLTVEVVVGATTYRESAIVAGDAHPNEFAEAENQLWLDVFDRIRWATRATCKRVNK